MSWLFFQRASFNYLRNKYSLRINNSRRYREKMLIGPFLTRSNKAFQLFRSNVKRSNFSSCIRGLRSPNSLPFLVFPTTLIAIKYKVKFQFKVWIKQSQMRYHFVLKFITNATVLYK